jgi:hypothetical protein
MFVVESDCDAMRKVLASTGRTTERTVRTERRIDERLSIEKFAIGSTCKEVCEWGKVGM